jgi:hypothetical protein
MQLEEVRELKNTLIKEVDLPKKIQKISGLIKTQDNRMTSEPIFLVQEKKRIYCDSGDVDENCWMNDGEEVLEDVSKELFEIYQEGGRISPDFELVGYYDVWEFVTCCFTNAGAEEYIRVNGHNLNEPRIYVASGWRNQEWIDVRNFLKNL